MALEGPEPLLIGPVFPGRVLGRNPRNRYFAHGAFSRVSPGRTFLPGCARSRPHRNSGRSVPSLPRVRDCRWGNAASAFVVLLPLRGSEAETLDLAVIWRVRRTTQVVFLQGPVSRAYPSTTRTRCSEASSHKGTGASPGSRVPSRLIRDAPRQTPFGFSTVIR